MKLWLATAYGPLRAIHTTLRSADVLDPILDPCGERRHREPTRG